MGCIPSNEMRANENKSKEIDKLISRDFRRENSTIKMLLLGAGESGKSTIVKQMKIINNNGYTKDECLQYKPIVFSNTLQSLTAIIRAMGQLKIEFSSPESIEDARKLFSLGKIIEEAVLSEDIFAAMQRLWNDDGVIACFIRSREYQLNDSAEYFLNSLGRLSKSDYIPTEQDVLHTRVKTTGIVETLVTFKGLNLKIVDVGGQRSERRKWIHCFEGVMTMIYVTSISEYDQFLIEDNEINRMFESIKLFDSVCNNQWFSKCSIILFLNKTDLFKLKISKSPLTICFPEYEGKNNFEEASHYVRMTFEMLNKKKEKIIYSHFTCATDTSNINHVFNVITDSIIAKNINAIGIF